MKDGQCPMCHSNQVYRNPNVNFRAGGQLVDLDDETYFIPYVCAQCGFTAMYVESEDELRGLPTAEGWERVAG